MMARIMFMYDTVNLYKEIQDHGPRTAEQRTANSRLRTTE